MDRYDVLEVVGRGSFGQVCVSECVCVYVCVCVSELQKHTNTHALSLCVLALTSALR